jgi:hypothetical protein
MTFLTRDYTRNVRLIATPMTSNSAAHTQPRHALAIRLLRRRGLRLRLAWRVLVRLVPLDARIAQAGTGQADRRARSGLAMRSAHALFP